MNLECKENTPAFSRNIILHKEASFSILHSLFVNKWGVPQKLTDKQVENDKDRPFPRVKMMKINMLQKMQLLIPR